MLALVVVARTSVGLRLPERVVRSEPRDAGGLGPHLVPRACSTAARCPTRSGSSATGACTSLCRTSCAGRRSPAFSERQVGFVDRLPLARQAAAILAGGPEGRSLAARLGVRYAVADPRCVPDLAARLAGRRSLANDGVVVVRLPPAADAQSAGGSDALGAAAGSALSRATSRRGSRSCRSPSWSPVNLPSS